VYRNISWVPTRTFLPDGVTGAVDERGFADTALTNPLAPFLETPSTALPEHPAPETYEGDVVDDHDLYQADAASPNWRLQVDGEDVERREAFGWANAYGIERAGRAQLSYDTPASLQTELRVQALLWLGTLLAMAFSRRPRAMRRRPTRRRPARQRPEPKRAARRPEPVDVR
jgi:hypothetical protein